MPLTAVDVAVLDRNAQAMGIPTALLMENAGKATAHVVTERFPEGRVLVLVGRGNNGGDGAVAARVLKQKGRDVRIVVAGTAGQMRTQVAKEALLQAVESGVPVVSAAEADLEREFAQARVVVDALLGVGARGSLREPVRSMVQAAQGSGRPVVAVDLPTGHDGEPVLPARVTVTMHDRKAGMREELCGEVVVADIGIPAEAGVVVGPGDLEHRYPRTPREAHKGKMGRLLIVGGGPYVGAPVLSGMGAFAAGTDMVRMVLPMHVARVAQERLLEAIVHPVMGERVSSAHGPFVEELVEDADVLLVGPGLGRDPDTMAAVRNLVEVASKQEGLRVVVDGDAFSAVREGCVDAVKGEGWVITPHAGEFRTLTGHELPGSTEGRLEVVQEWLGDDGGVVLLKGPEDLIVSRAAHAMNRVHDPVMTTAGTGDVLAGVVAALLGRGMSPFDAARVAAYLNGRAGVLAREDLGYGVRARDVARRIPLVLADVFQADVKTRLQGPAGGRPARAGRGPVKRKCGAPPAAKKAATPQAPDLAGFPQDPSGRADFCLRPLSRGAATRAPERDNSPREGARARGGPGPREVRRAGGRIDGQGIRPPGLRGRVRRRA